MVLAEIKVDNIYATWFKFRPPTRRNMTEEQKQALRERLAAAKEAKMNETENETVE